MAPQPQNFPDNGNAQIEMRCCACDKPITTGGMRFPKCPDLKATWLQMIREQAPNFPGREERLRQNGLTLCTHHFEPSMLIRKTEGGQDVYALKKGGVPTIFNSCEDQKGEIWPSTNNSDMDVDSTTPGDDEISICYESNSTVDGKTKGGDTDPNIVQIEDTADILHVANNAATDGCSTDHYITNIKSIAVVPEPEMLTSLEPVSETDSIPSLEEFMSLLRLKNDKFYHPWRISYNENSVLFTLFDDDCKYLILSFTVDGTLKVSVFFHGHSFIDGLTEVLGGELKLDTWTKFKQLVLFLHRLPNDKIHNTLQLKQACRLIKNCIEVGPLYESTQQQIKKWKFLVDQLESSNGESQSFSAENLQWAIRAYTINRQGYSKIFESDVLTLPHPASLELFVRQTLQKSRQPPPRPKILQKKPTRPFLEPSLPSGNGLSPSTPISNGPLHSRNQFQIKPPASTITGTSHTNPSTSSGRNGFSKSNGKVIEEIDFEIEEIS